MKVCLDAGHGGTNIGAVRHPLHENKLNLELQHHLHSLLLGKGHEVKTLRIADKSISNSKCAEIANDWGADVFISIHHNAFHLKTANGFEVLHYKRSQKGQWLANRLCFNVCGKHGLCKWPIRNRGPKPRTNLIVLRDTQMPAILIEAGFISSKIDRRASLVNRRKRWLFYDCIAKSVVEVLHAYKINFS